MSESFFVTAADVLFNHETLDNAMRGIYIEALIFDALRSDKRWRYVGLGWGPWDLQRGTHQDGDRIRVQVKVKANDQMWPSPHKPRHEYGLGWKEKPLRYFEPYYDKAIYGECEPEGYRCELFLFAWNGPDLSQPPPDGLFPQTYEKDQRNPHNYVYTIRRTSEFTNELRTDLKLHVVSAFKHERLTFRESRASNPNTPSFAAPTH